MGPSPPDAASGTREEAMSAKRIRALEAILCLAGMPGLMSCHSSSGSIVTDPFPPTVSAISPSSIAAGTAGLTLTVMGSNFTTRSVVRWNGADRATTFVSSTQLTAAITAADVSSGGTASVAVFTPAPGGGLSAAVVVTINNPLPVVTALSPASVMAGDAAFALTVDGSNFVPGAVVRWNGSDRATTFVSSTQLTAAIPASDVATAGSANVTVLNPAPGGGTSTALAFTANQPVPPANDDFSNALNINLSGATPLPFSHVTDTRNATAHASDPIPPCLDPVFLVIGDGRANSVWYKYTPAQDMTLHARSSDPFLTASPFPVLSVWTGAPGSFSLVACMQDDPVRALDAAVSFSATAGTTYYFMLSESNEVRGFFLDATNPAPAVATLSPSTATAGASGFTLEVNGSGFVATSVVRWNGYSRPTTFVSSTRLTAAIPASDVATAGSANVTVLNPAPGGGASTALSFDVSAPVSVTVSPSSIGPDQGATQQFTATVTGAANGGVSWSVQEGASGGSINSDGLYTAPAATGTYHVVATSLADPTKTATAAVHVPDVTIAIGPDPVFVARERAQQFSALVQGSIEKRVTWLVAEGSAGGSVNDSGLYTAPTSLGRFHVVATSMADSTKTATAAVTVVEAGFVYAGEMVERREYHTATLLPNGEVLVAGGISRCTLDEASTYVCEDKVLASAEIFDPSTNEFRSTGDMSEPRVYHSATLLPNGKVLIVGLSAVAELYDPVTGQFTPTGRMSRSRSEHQATLLPSGLVLVTGGEDFPGSGGMVAAAEIYDPATGSFSPVGNMTVGRKSHTATLLADGRVLIAGGSTYVGGQCNVSAPAEIFDSATGNFTALPNSEITRESHSATLLGDGRVLLAGGTPACTYSGLPVAQLFDPQTNTMSPLISMTDGRRDHTATLLPDGTVLLTGGNLPFLGSAEVFDPQNETLTATPNLLMFRLGHAATLLLDGRVLITGGSAHSYSADKSAEVYQ
jgi:hypothetical protein